MNIKTNSGEDMYAENINRNNPIIKNVAIIGILKKAAKEEIVKRDIATNMSGLPASTCINHF